MAPPKKPRDADGNIIREPVAALTATTVADWLIVAHATDRPAYDRVWTRLQDAGIVAKLMEGLP